MSSKANTPGKNTGRPQPVKRQVQPTAIAANSIPGTQPPANTGRKQVHPVTIVLVCTAIVFLPSLFNQFVNWDDPKYFWENPDIVNATAGTLFKSISTFFTTSVIGGYTPLVSMTFLFEQMVFGLEHPFIWHLDNLLLHLLCTWLVYRLCHRLQFTTTVCFITALLFGVHPMHVESVAWVTERKDLLYSAFFLGALVRYVRYQTEGGQKQLYMVYLLFALSLLSKIQAVSLPLSLILIDYYLSGKLQARMLLNKVPFFLLSAITGIAGIVLLQQAALLATESTPAMPLLRGAYSIVVYLAKSIGPYKLAAIYPYPVTASWYMYLSLLIIPILAVIIYRAWKQNNKVVVLGLLFFLCNVFFMLQMLAAGQGYLADRYIYIPYLGLFLVYAIYFEKALQHYTANQRNLKIAGGAYVLILGIAALLQTLVWQNSETLWQHELKYYSEQGTPYFNLGIYYHKTGNLPEAIAAFDHAIQIEPDNAENYQSRGEVIFETAGNSKSLVLKALADCNKAIALKNNAAPFYNNRANVYGKLNQMDAALADVNTCIALDPDNSQAYHTRYVIHMQQQQWESALQDAEKIVAMNPDDEDMQADLQQLRRKVRR